MSLGHSHAHPHHDTHAIQLGVMRVGQISFAVAFGVILFKLLAWKLSGSVALLSDVLESITHIITAGITLFALKVSHQPADRDHPYGHHKAEYFSALVEAAFIISAAALVLYEAIPRLFAPQMPTINTAVIAATLTATAFNGGWAWYLITHGRKAGSPALSADGWHLFTDVATSVGVLIGLLLAQSTGWAWVDPAIACVVAVQILWAAYRIMGEALSSLMDKSASHKVESHICELVKQYGGKKMLEIHALKTRVAGRATFIEFHLVVDGKMTVNESHALCDKLEQALVHHIRGAQVVIHVEPEGAIEHPSQT